MAPSLRIRILLPLTFALLAIMVIVLVGSSNSLRTRVLGHVSDHRILFDDLLAEEIDDVATLMVTTGQALWRDPALVEALAVGKEAVLAASTASLFRTLARQDRITDLAFLDPHGRVVQGRTEVESGRDSVQHHTFQRAQRLGVAAHGLEVDPAGRLMLFAVVPWERHGETAGFVQFGLAAAVILEGVARELGDIELTALYKSALQEEAWTAAHPRVPGAWNTSTDVVLHHVGNVPSREDLARALPGLRGPEGTRPEYISEEGRQFHGVWIPLWDSRDIPVGEILLLVDVTSQVAGAWKAQWMTGASVLVLAALTLTLLYVVAGRAERQLRVTVRHLADARDHLEERVSQRTHALAESQSRLAQAQRIARLGNWEVLVPSGTWFWSDELYTVLGLEGGAGAPSLRRGLLRVPAENRAVVLRRVRACVRARCRELDMELPIRTAGAGQRYVVGRASLDYDESGVLVRVRGTLQDITRRKMAEQELAEHRTHLRKLVAARTRELREKAAALKRSEAVYRAVVEDQTELICRIRIDGTLEFANHAFCRYYGWDREALIGQRFVPFMDVDDHRGIAACVEGVDPDRPVLEVEYRQQLEQGQSRWQVWSVRPMFDQAHRLVEVLAVGRDVTVRKRAEEALRRQARELESVNRELETFSYSVSHDLRAPLRAIGGFSQALREDYEGVLDATGLEYLDRVRSAARRMGELIDALLGLSRVSRREMCSVRVDVSVLALEVVNTLRQADPQRKVAFHVTPGIRVQGDRALLKIVLENLLGNAWKYTRDREQAVIELGEERRNSKSWVYVRDNGVGFDMSFVDRLFQPFQRLHREEEFEGAGIGLATVARIIHRHGGRVDARGEQGSGTTVCFFVPGAN